MIGLWNIEINQQKMVILIKAYDFCALKSHKAAPSLALAVITNLSSIGWNMTAWKGARYFTMHIPSLTLQRKSNISTRPSSPAVEKILSFEGSTDNP